MSRLCYIDVYLMSSDGYKYHTYDIDEYWVHWVCWVMNWILLCIMVIAMCEIHKWLSIFIHDSKQLNTTLSIGLTVVHNSVNRVIHTSWLTYLKFVIHFQYGVGSTCSQWAIVFKRDMSSY